MNDKNDPSFIAAGVLQAEITQPPQRRSSEEMRTIIVGSIALGPSKLLTREEEVQLFGELNLGRQAQTAKIVCNGLRGFLGYEPSEAPEVEQIIDRGKEARDKIIMSNTRLVFSRACKLQNRGLKLPDLFQEGMFGLFKAIDKFDPSRGLSLSTLATKCIDQFIKRAIKDNKRNIHIPIGVSDSVNMIMNKREELLQRNHGREPTPEEIAEELGMDSGQIDNEGLIMYRGRTISLNAPRASDESSGGHTLIERVSDSTQAGTEEKAVDLLTKGEKRRELLSLMESASLTDREKLVLGIRYGLGTVGKGLSDVEIGRLSDVTRQRIQQIAMRAIGKLRTAAGISTVKEILEQIKTPDQADDS